MIIKFQKFQGTGNEFIIIDNRNQVYEFTREIVEYFCDRKFGIGADGLSTALLNHDHSGTYTLQAQGGILKVSFKQLADNHFTDIWLEGPAEFVFAGEIGTPQTRGKKAM